MNKNLSKPIRIAAACLSLTLFSTFAFSGNITLSYSGMAGRANGAGPSKAAALNDISNTVARHAKCGNRARFDLKTIKYTGFYNNTWWGVEASWYC